MPPETRQRPTIILLTTYHCRAFPSQHDITLRYLPQILAWLRELLDRGNKVLIVTKPHLECVVAMCADLASYKHRILWRFTINSLDPILTRFWEPGAPSPRERIASLQYAFHHGWHTSVSVEPMLAGTEDAVRAVNRVMPLVTETVWIGKMNNIRQYVSRDTPAIAAACQLVKQLQADPAILDLVRHVRHHRKVRLKDSIHKVIARCHPQGPGRLLGVVGTSGRLAAPRRFPRRPRATTCQNRFEGRCPTLRSPWLGAASYSLRPGLNGYALPGRTAERSGLAHPFAAQRGTRTNTQWFLTPAQSPGS